MTGSSKPDTPKDSKLDSNRGPRSRGHSIFLGAALALVIVASGASALMLTSRGPEQAASQSPRSQVDRMINEGLVHYGNGELEAAETSFKAALALQPKNIRARYDLGVVKGARGMSADAVRQYKMVLALNPTFSPALYNLASAQAARGDRSAAIETYGRVIAAHPDNASAVWNLGLLLWARGDKTAARRLLKKATNLTPTLRSRLPAGITLK